MFADIFAILAPVFITTGLGYFWARAGKHFDTNLVTSIVTYFATPCLTFAALATVELGGDTLVLMGTAALAANVIFALIGWPVLKVFNLSPRTYLQSLTWPNVGNVGLPLCLLAYGQEGLALSVAFFAAYVVIQLTIGVAFVSGSFSIKSLAKMPIIPATLIATGFLATDTAVPEWLYNTTNLIGQLTIPLMLFTLGVSLAKLRPVSLARSTALSFLRLGMGFGVGFGLSEVMGLTGMERGVVILQCSMPVAVFCYLFAQLYNREPEEVAGVVISSSFLAAIALPALLWYVL
ncbi:AEC family transporter [Thalassospira sp.]|uniref:AEC family transporter n=1 Tax=Thalassospira sp. TaxID=1912094 RepID=UPI001B274431|nr:AEC family transporter [Thalassospira sp.]MBO6807721.1 AEC family transporter [Thalassospira sp.]MBO6840246.1 AEC family transporter [Thalassospira sp.]